MFNLQSIIDQVKAIRDEIQPLTETALEKVASITRTISDLAADASGYLSDFSKQLDSAASGLDKNSFVEQKKTLEGVQDEVSSMAPECPHASVLSKLLTSTVDLIMFKADAVEEKL